MLIIMMTFNKNALNWLKKNMKNVKIFTLKDNVTNWSNNFLPLIPVIAIKAGSTNILDLTLALVSYGNLVTKIWIRTRRINCEQS